MATDDNSEHEMTIGQLKTHIDERFDAVNERFNDVDGRFNHVDERFNHVDERFNHVDERFKGVDERFKGVDGRFKSINQQFNDMEERFAAVETRIADEGVQTRRHFDVIAESLRAEISLRFEGTQTTLDNHERRIQALEKRRR